MTMKNYRDENWLRVKFEEDNLSRSDIAERCGVSHKTVMKYCKRFNIGDDLEECPNCGYKSPQLGNHWSGEKCEYPELTQYQRDVLTGILMSDGHINKPQENQNPRFRVDMYEKSIPYLEYLSGEVFPIITTEVKQGETASSRDRDSNTFDINVKKCSDMYFLSSRRMPCFERYLQWYNDDGHKFWPCEDIYMNSTVFKHLYVGDGHLKTRSGTPYISIALNDQRKVIDDVVQMFEEWGVSPSVVEFQREETTDVRIHFKKYDTEKIFKWIGEPLPGFEYKWPEQYRND